MVNTVVTRAARIDAPPTTIAKAPDDGRFGETLKAGVAVEAPVATAPATPATPTVGKIPVAMMRPPDVSSPEDAAAKTATRAHEQEHGKTSQDTGAVSVAKDAAKKDDDETNPKPQPIAPEAALPIAALQPLPMPLPPATVAPVAQDAKPAVAVGKTATKKDEIAPTNSIAGNTPDASAPMDIAVQTNRSALPATFEIAPAHAHAAAITGIAAKSTATIEAAPKTVTPTELPDMKTLAATPNVLEVGIATGTHGWLRVRAELGQMGEVTASLAAASASAADGLHKELPAISAYLSSERVGVSSLTVNATEESPGMSSSGERSGSRERRQASHADAAPDDGNGLDFNFMGMNLPAAVYANGSGSWLSVRV
jgi:hypothetical protein